jgi:hypothetical protein
MVSFFSLLNGVASDPILLVSQLGIVLLACFLIFLLFFALRDILHRSHSLAYQFLSILLVAALPFVGFGVYLLIRPNRTVQQRKTDAMVDDLWHRFCAEQKQDVIPQDVADTKIPASDSNSSSTPSV